MKHYSKCNLDDYSFKLGKYERKKKVNYCQDIFTLDTEATTLFANDEGDSMPYSNEFGPEVYNNLNNIGIVYIWMLSINDDVYYGRYLFELENFVNDIHEHMKERTFVIYVHNLAYDFQFLRNVFTFTSVFAREKRKPMKAVCEDIKVEFRCSYILSGLSLEYTAKLNALPVKKLKGDLDYSLVRHSETPLTAEELQYCENDCLVIYEYIKMMLTQYKKMEKIPLTATSIIREMFKDYIKEQDPKWGLLAWKTDVAKLTPDLEEFKRLVRTFQGGYTHSNASFTDQLIYDVCSIDFASSYPFVMLSEKYASSRYTKIDDPKFEDIDEKDHCYIIDVTLNNIEVSGYMSAISLSKCVEKSENRLADNGRIYSADMVRVVVNEQDFFTILENYKIESYTINEMYEACKSYLPKMFVEFIIKLYKVKNDIKKELKTYPESSKEYTECNVRYKKSKGNLNSLYGMCVTNYIQDEISFDIDGWQKFELTEDDINEKLDEFKDKKKLLFPYSWGCQVAAYARRNLWLGIEAVGFDCVYCDTDSIKYMISENESNINKYIDEYAKRCDDKLKAMCDFYDLDFEDVRGLGYFDPDGSYKEFKTLGAKKYAYRENEPDKNTGKCELHMTISGVPKSSVKALNDDILNFADGFIFDVNSCQKNLRTYNDEQTPIKVVDYLGNESNEFQQYGISIYPTTYKLSIVPEYGNIIEYLSESCGLEIFKDF